MTQIDAEREREKERDREKRERERDRGRKRTSRQSPLRAFLIPFPENMKPTRYD